MRAFLRIITLAGALAPQLAATQTSPILADDLYKAETIVTGTGESERMRGFRIDAKWAMNGMTFDAAERCYRPGCGRLFEAELDEEGKYMRGFVPTIAALLALTFAQPGAAQRAEHRAGEFDYYALVLNWSPSYCATRQGGNRPGEPQCSGDRPYSFILHGLWPQYSRGWPQDCRTQERPWVPEDLIGRMLDIMPSKRLIIHEYRKHGTCSGLSPTDYFRTARQLYDQIRIPPRFQNPDGYLTLSPADVESEFLTANPQLKPEMISIACKGRNLGDLRICFGRDLKLQSCGVNETQAKLCSSEKIVMPPVRLGARSYGGDGDDPNEARGEERNQDQNEDENQGEDRD